MSKAGINTIYIYTADATQDHDACMRVFADQGIYVWLQLGDFPRVSSEVRQTFLVQYIPSLTRSTVRKDPRVDAVALRRMDRSARHIRRLQQHTRLWHRPGEYQ